MQDKIDADLNLDGPIWHFALAFYGTPGVPQQCLKLQDEAGLDVVALIGVLFSYTALDRSMDAVGIAALREAMKPWRDETVLPIRFLRRALKAPPEEFPAAETEQLRELIKKAELKAEQIQLALTARWIASYRVQDGLTLEDALAQLTAVAEERPTTSLVSLVLAARAASARLV